MRGPGVNMSFLYFMKNAHLRCCHTSQRDNHGARAEQHGRLSLTEFAELFKENWGFVVATESLAKRMIVSLRGVTASQVSIFHKVQKP
jgi:hypothetical protein